MRKLLWITGVSILSLFIFGHYQLGERERMEPNEDSEVRRLALPPNLQMYEAIEKYSKEYGVPKRFGYGIAYKESRYRGLLDWGYNNSLESPAGALGAMQVMYATAKSMWPNKDFTKEQLKNDIDFNVRTSMKLLRLLYDQYHDWTLVFGAYNTGKLIRNDYAYFVNDFNPVDYHITQK